MNLSVCVHRRTHENIRPADGRHTGGSAPPNLHRLWLFLQLCILVGMTGERRRAESGVKDGDDNMIPLRMHGVTRISGETTCKWAPWWSPADMESSVVVQTSRIITEGQKSRRIACLLPTIRSASLLKIYWSTTVKTGFNGKGGGYGIRDSSSKMCEDCLTGTHESGLYWVLYSDLLAEWTQSRWCSVQPRRNLTT